MKKIFWILVLGAVGSAAMAVGLGHAAAKKDSAQARP
jgi:hypothetical protein